MVSSAGSASPGRSPEPVWIVDHEWSAPGEPTRCVVYRSSGTAHAAINAAHGLEAYDHAAYHARAIRDGALVVCRRDEPCGYAGDASAGRC
jgi:hypothetical protein